MASVDLDSPMASGSQHDDDPDTPTRSLHMPKNRKCPFCGDSFTSSSLGRHLDLYIKDKNPKAADGIHDVDRIRELRAHITRRQPRRSAAQRASLAAAAATAAANGHGPATPSTNGGQTASGSASHLAHSAVDTTTDPQAPGQGLFARPSWETTGVMTDIPSVADHSETHFQPFQRPANRLEPGLRKRLSDDRLRLRATELALQEVLDSVRAASAAEAPLQPFDFDFFSYNFAGLCLRLLRPPADFKMLEPNTIGERVWPAQAPDIQHLHIMRDTLHRRLEVFEADRQRRHNRERSSLLAAMSGLSNGHHSPTFGLAPFETTPYQEHLQAVWDFYAALPKTKKDEAWHLEVLRAHARESADHAETRARLERAEAQVQHLQLQMQRLSELQQPRDFLSTPPQQLPISKGAAHSVMASLSVASEQAQDSGSAAWDKDLIVQRWISRVKTNAVFQRWPDSSIGADSNAPLRGGADAADAESRLDLAGQSRPMADSSHDDANQALPAEKIPRTQHDANNFKANNSSRLRSNKAAGAPMHGDVLDPTLRGATAGGAGVNPGYRTMDVMDVDMAVAEHGAATKQRVEAGHNAADSGMIHVDSVDGVGVGADGDGDEADADADADADVEVNLHGNNAALHLQGNHATTGSHLGPEQLLVGMRSAAPMPDPRAPAELRGRRSSARRT